MQNVAEGDNVMRNVAKKKIQNAMHNAATSGKALHHWRLLVKAMQNVAFWGQSEHNPDPASSTTVLPAANTL